MAGAAARLDSETRDARRERRSAEGRRCGDLPLLNSTWEALIELTGVEWETKRGEGYHAAMDAHAKLIDLAVTELAMKISTRGKYAAVNLPSSQDQDPLAVWVDDDEDEDDD